MTPLSVLYVDDEPELLEICKMFLERSGGCVVATCESAADAMRRLSNESFDVIVSDYMMPECDGIRFLKYLREHGDSTPYIIFTGKGREEVVIEAFECGADFYLQKGGDVRVQFLELAQKIRKAVDLKRAEEARIESEEKYRILVENANEGILVVQDGVIRFCNSKLGTLLDREPTDLIGTPIEGFIHPDDREFVMDRHRTRLAGEDIPTNYKFRVISLTGSIHWVLINATRIYWEDRPALLILLSDVTEQKEAEERLQESDERYRSLFDQSSDGIYLHDLDGNILDVNNAAIAQSGYSRDELLRMTIFDLHRDSADREEILGQWHGWKQGEPVTIETVHKRKDGSIFPAEVRTGAVRIRDQNFILALLRDITDRKQAEEAMGESEEKFRTIFENSPYPIAINSDPGFKFLEINKAFLDASGYTEEEVLGKDPAEMGLIPLTQVMKLLSRRLIRGRLENVPLALTVKGDKRIHVIFSTIPVTINNKPAMVTVTTEVTKLKRIEEELLQKNEELNAAYEQLAAIEQELRHNYDELSKNEAALRESEEKFRALVEHSFEGILITDFSGGLLFANQAAGDIVEASDYRALIGKINVLDFVAPESKKDVMKDFQNVAGGTDAYPVNYKLVTEKNRERWVECIGKRVPFGESFAMLVSMRDVTERKRAEERLRESEIKFSSAFQSSPVALTLVSATNGRFLEINDSFMKNTGYSRDEVIGKTAEELGIFADGREHERLVTLLREQITVHGMELKCRTKPGELRTCLFSSAVIMAGGKPQILSTIQDTTERKVAEEAHQVMIKGMVGTTGLSSLQSIAEHISSWLDAVCVMIGEIQPDGKTVKTLSMILDGQAVSDFSYALENTPCGNVARKGFCIYPDGAAGQFPENTYLADQKIRGYMGTPLRDSAGEVIGILCVMSRNPLSPSLTIREYLDLVAVKVAAELERIRIDRELKESRRRLAEAMDLADLVAWECDVPTEMFTFDDRFYALYATSAEREGGTQMSAETYAREFVYPDDRHVVADEMERARQTTDPDFVSQLEHRIVRRDGQIRKIMVRFGVTKDEHGRTIKTHGANQDITDRKQAEEALWKAHRQIKILTGITRHDILNSIMVAVGYLDLVQDAEPAEQKQYLERIKYIIGKIQRQIEFTREYETLGSQEPRWQDFGAVIRNLEIPESITFATNGLTWMVFADPMLKKVFENLLDNSLRHGVTVSRIGVSCDVLDGRLRIAWEDDGAGVPADEKEKIFDRGYGKNSGLGLFLAREILGLTGISIQETGQPGRGARFEITVPDGIFRG